MRRELFNPEEIPADLRQYFEEVETTCAAPWARVISREGGATEATARPKHLQSAKSTLSLSGHAGAGWEDRGSVSTTLGWRPTCPASCHQGRPPVPATVMDIFGGAGTTGLVADRLGRDAVLVELKSDYIKMATRRIVGDAPLFAQVSEEAAG